MNKYLIKEDFEDYLSIKKHISICLELQLCPKFDSIQKLQLYGKLKYIKNKYCNQKWREDNPNIENQKRIEWNGVLENYNSQKELVLQEQNKNQEKKTEINEFRRKKLMKTFIISKIASQAQHKIPNLDYLRFSGKIRIGMEHKYMHKLKKTKLGILM